MVINNREYLKRQIIGQSRHQFIYGYNDENRKKIIEELVSEYSIKLNENIPMVIYLKNWGLPNISVEQLEVDKDIINSLSKDYLNFTILSEIISKIKHYNFEEENIIKLFNRYLNENHPKITNLDELIVVLEKTKEIYIKFYLEYIKTGKLDKYLNDIAIEFLILEIL